MSFSKKTEAPNNAQEGFREHALFLQRTQKNRLFPKPLNSALYLKTKMYSNNFILLPNFQLKDRVLCQTL